MRNPNGDLLARAFRNNVTPAEQSREERRRAEHAIDREVIEFYRELFNLVMDYFGDEEGRHVPSTGTDHCHECGQDWPCPIAKASQVLGRDIPPSQPARPEWAYTEGDPF